MPYLVYGFLFLFYIQRQFNSEQFHHTAKQQR